MTNSKSKRTEVVPEFGDDGELRLTVIRDGRTVHHFHLNREEAPVEPEEVFKSIR